jgi:hypothetical protein
VYDLTLNLGIAQNSQKIKKQERTERPKLRINNQRELDNRGLKE